MGWAIWALAGALLVVAVLAGVLGMLRAERRRSRTALAAAAAEQARLEARLEQLSRPPERTPAVDDGSPDWVITFDGDPDDDVAPRRVSNQLVLSAAFGEPLVKTLAFGHGVRRALSPASRNRIRFEMRHETRRSRKVRRREMRQAWKQMRAERGTDPETAGPPSDREDVA